VKLPNLHSVSPVFLDHFHRQQDRKTVFNAKQDCTPVSLPAGNVVIAQPASGPLLAAILNVVIAQLEGTVQQQDATLAHRDSIEVKRLTRQNVFSAPEANIKTR